MAPGRYLIVRLSALGDVVFALESLAALRRAEPEAVVDWLIEDRASGLLEGHPWIHRLLVYPRRTILHQLARPWRWFSLAGTLWRHVRNVRETSYDAVLDLHGNAKSGMHVLLARAERKIGFGRDRARDLAWLAVGERVSLGGRQLHRAEQGLVLIAQLTKPHAELRAAGPANDAALLPIDHGAMARAHALFPNLARPATPTVCLIPGTSAFGEFKRWPVESFRRLALALEADGLNVIVCTGPGEVPLAQRIHEGRPATAWFDGATHGLSLLTEVFRGAQCAVAADSGPLHMTQAVGTPAVALFGPKDPEIYGPRLPESIVLRYPTTCTPCGRRRCDAPICVRAIPVQDVRDAVHELLQTSVSPS